MTSPCMIWGLISEAAKLKLFYNRANHSSVPEMGFTDIIKDADISKHGWKHESLEWKSRKVKILVFSKYFVSVLGSALHHLHCSKSFRIRSFSGPYFPAVGLNTETYSASLRIQSECGKYGPEKLGIWTLFTQCFGWILLIIA